MSYSNFDQYLETEVFSADPVKLVCILYRGAIEAVGAARRHVKAGEIRERSRQITKAHEILYELYRSLDKSLPIGQQLAELYTYMQSRVLEANSKQIEAPLEEVENLLNTLLEGWRAAVPVEAAVVEHLKHESISCVG